MLEALATSLFDPLEERLHHNIDLLVFNPPYVPTASDEADEGQTSRGIYGSWAGGALGMETTTLVLDKLDVCIPIPSRSYMI